jgi:hypothetical protein
VGGSKQATPPHSGHRGGTSTYNAIKVRFFWRNLHKDVLELNKACHECNVSKISRKAPQGLLQPVEVPLGSSVCSANGLPTEASTHLPQLRSRICWIESIRQQY